MDEAFTASSLRLLHGVYYTLAVENVLCSLISFSFIFQLCPLVRHILPLAVKWNKSLLFSLVFPCIIV